MKKNTILLFVSKDSASFHHAVKEFKKLTKKLEEIKSISLKLIDIVSKPELAEKYKIEALPTLVFGNLRLIGKPDAERMASAVMEVKEDQDFFDLYHK